jgi:hypothetical protein
MDQRDPRRITPPDGRPRGPAEVDIDLGVERPGPVRGFDRRFARLVSPPVTRPTDLRRVGLALAVTAAGAVFIGLLARSVVLYLHAHPTYQVSYDQIVLDPPPPAWYRGGARAFLENVWTPTREPRAYSVLDLDPNRLALLFQRYAWVRRVRKVETGHPNRVVVHLDYFEPVAEDAGTGTVIDRDGVILARDDIDPDAVGRLIRLKRFTPPDKPTPGEVWSRVDTPQGVARPDPEVVSAACLAGFLMRKLDTTSAGPSRRPAVRLWHYDRHGLYVEVEVPGGGWLMLLWEDPTYPPAVRKMTPEEKWVILNDWLAREPPPGKEGVVYLRLTEHGAALDPERDPRNRDVPRTGLNSRERTRPR